MKRILLATALIAATATVAAASPSINELPQTKAFEVRLLVPNADLSNLSSSQVLALENVLSSKDDRSANAGAIKVILNLN